MSKDLIVINFHFLLTTRAHSSHRNVKRAIDFLQDSNVLNVSNELQMSDTINVSINYSYFVMHAYTRHQKILLAINFYLRLINFKHYLSSSSPSSFSFLNRRSEKLQKKPKSGNCALRVLI
jgi:hypothetical protein